MADILSPVTGEQVNRRFAGTQHGVFWTPQDLTCRVCNAPAVLSSTELRSAVDALIEVGCVRHPSEVDESAEGLTFHWSGVGKLTYVWEWPAEGWRAAAMMALRALGVLRRRDLTLRALQHGDLLMVGSEPTIANVGAVTRWSLDTERRTVEQLQRYFVRPLRYAVQGYAGLARRLLRSDLSGILAEEGKVVGITDGTVDAPDVSTDWLGALVLPYQSASESWRTYEARMTSARAEEIAAKSTVVLTTVNRLKPASVLDLGCNTGLFSQLAANEGATVTGVDCQEDCLNIYFTRASAWSMPATAVLMNLADPSPVRGWGEGWCTSAGERLSSDLVIAFAVIHHLALGARMRVTELRACFASLARRWLLLEFVPLDPTNPYTWGGDFYTLNWLMDVLAPDFITRQTWQHGARDRVVLLLERRD
jgi:SAM-dependent methyltransferase